MIRAVIFDIDGTLVDSVDLHAQAWKETFKHFGKDIPYQMVRHQIGKGGQAAAGQHPARFLTIPFTLHFQRK